LVLVVSYVLIVVIGVVKRKGRKGRKEEQRNTGFWRVHTFFTMALDPAPLAQDDRSEILTMPGLIFAPLSGVLCVLCG
jgi:hypothetical protein